MLTLAAFAAALAMLIAVHEYGHYRAARACGVKVLRFSIGFGRPLVRWKSNKSGTEFAVAILPLGGFVKMLDERDGPVTLSERTNAFNNKSLYAKAIIVFAGPAANLLLAILLYSIVNWTGTKVPSSVISGPVRGSLADKAGLQSGDRVVGLAKGNDRVQSVRSFDDLYWIITRSALDGQDLRMIVKRAEIQTEFELKLRLSELVVREADAAMLGRIGIIGPYSPPVIGGVFDGLPAQIAGLVAGDWVISVDAQPILDAQHLRQLVRQSASSGVTKSSVWHVRRAGQTQAFVVTPQLWNEGDVPIGKIGAMIGAAPEMLDQHYGFLGGVGRALHRTWESATLTVAMIVRMVLGEVSVRNLSGPLTIADYAGKTASMGWTQYLTFLALISVSLGVLNLLPLPVLDGGHLMYYLWEGLTGRPVPDVVMDQLQRGGLIVLVCVTAIALFNDITRLLG